MSENIQLSISDLLSENTDFIWTSSDESIVKVNAQGKVTAIKAGTAKIQAKNADNSFSEFINIKVVDSGQAQNFRLAINLIPNQTARLYLSDDGITTWRSLDESIVTVDATGKVTGVSKGLALVQAENNGKTKLIYVRVS